MGIFIQPRRTPKHIQKKLNGVSTTQKHANTRNLWKRRLSNPDKRYLYQEGISKGKATVLSGGFFASAVFFDFTFFGSALFGAASTSAGFFFGHIPHLLSFF